MNTCAYLEKAARQWGDNLAYVHGADSIDYRGFYDRVLRLAGGLLALGLQRGDRVAYALPNSPRILETVYACFAAGLIVVPINARLHPREMAYIATDSAARVLIYGPTFDEGLREHRALFGTVEHWIGIEPHAGAAVFEEILQSGPRLERPVDVDPTEPCWLFYTSGTTGRPKGATWSHRTTSAVTMNYLADVYNIQPGEVVLHTAPMSHGSGIVAMPVVARGATNAIMDTASFDPKSLFETIERTRTSHIAFVAPTQIIAMLDAFKPGEYDLSGLRAICYGGAPIYVEQLRRAIDAFGPIFTQIYGQGEAPITISGLPASAHRSLIEAGDGRIGSAGQVRTDVEVRIIGPDDEILPLGSVGEIVARGDVVMLGYWNNPEATAETLRDGWLHTGDVGLLDDQGYLYLLDRAKDIIISGGNNIYPREVEEVIVQHPGVFNCVVLGVPHDYWGEAVHAVVMPEAGVELDEQEIIGFCSQYLAGYKKPKSVEIVDELPLSGYGKVQRREMREKYWVGHGRAIGGGGIDQPEHSA
ncbi:AMP-binding protein [Agrococcus baldri]|uniref:AMP-dependent synthetase n=1 Tax=Agrococcus baldri TaxID=153730 RepID=A0AA87REG8_9MICO|nr:AMP-binding protein [Agrococcus baldri]GEK79106.1 AMP-dependent synthetase [Agrococcus baldri]